MNREQLEAEYQMMINRIKEMTKENEKIISRSSAIIMDSKPTEEDVTRPEARTI